MWVYYGTITRSLLDDLRRPPDFRKDRRSDFSAVHCAKQDVDRGARREKYDETLAVIRSARAVVTRRTHSICRSANSDNKRQEGATAALYMRSL